MGGWISTSGTTTLVSRPDGKVLFFALKNGAWVADADNTDTLVQLANASGWKYTMADGTVEIYNAGGKRTSITNRAGLTQTTSYSDGTTGPNGGYLIYANGTSTGNVLPANYPIRVTDPNGRSLKIQYGYDASNSTIFPIRITDPAGGLYQYAYDGNYNLTQVTYPDGKTKKYLYSEVTNVSATPNAGVFNAHLLTGIIDENGVRYASYWYDAQGKAYKEEIAPNANLGIDKHTMVYTTDASGNPVSTTVTDPLNTARIYNFSIIVGIPRSTGQSQPAGAGCGAASSAVTYDANGNVASRTDFNGNKTCYAYDLSRNLETVRIEGLPIGADCTASLNATSLTLPARKISTTWHATYRLPVSIAEPKRITSFDLDPATGNLLTKTVKATNDTTGVQGIAAGVVGVPRIWSYTYNGVGQILTAKSPRTDVNDTTTYVYEPATGNLQTVTNSAGHVTSLSNYDANGRVGQITDPNGLVTVLDYYPRGWLKTKTVTGNGVSELTGYEYDGVGQLKKVTLPDSSWVGYDYDGAHRLTDVYDSASNTIHYVLDAMGNRTNEQVKDPQGNLSRQVSRIYDALNRLQFVTGATQ